MRCLPAPSPALLLLRCGVRCTCPARWLWAGLLSTKLGLKCYKKLGFTDGCAAIWNYDGIDDGKGCGLTCAKTIAERKPNNGPPPLCALNACLECDEVHAGPHFKRFAARTRRRSGLLSAIVRPCSSVPRIIHAPCPDKA